MNLPKVSIIVSDIAKSGGTERAVINLSNLLISDYDVEIISMHNKQKTIAPYYEVHSLVKMSSFQLNLKSSLQNFLINHKTLKKYFKENQTNFIIGSWYGVNIILPFLKTKLTKVIATEHADFQVNPKMVKLLAQQLYPKLSAIVTLSDVAKKKMKTYNKNIITISNSLPFEVTESSTLNQKRILMVGRFVAVKGYERVIPLAKYLQDNHADWSIDIFGDGELKEDLLASIASHNIKNIKINDAVKNIKKEYLSSSLFLSTSYNEAMPMVFLEAMSCGVPVISYKNEGADCLIQDNVDGMIVTNEEELNIKMNEIISKASLRESLAKNAKNTSRQYEANNIKKLWLLLLKNQL